MQKGFINLQLYIALGAAVVIGIMYLRIDYLEMKVELADAFQESVEREGETARKEARRINKENLAKKEKADAELKKLRLANAEFKRLRDSAPSRRLPEAPANSRNPELSCFDRPELERAYGELVKELRGIADEGTESTLALDSVKRWAQQ